VGSLPTTTAAAPATGDPAAGEALFKSQGCGGCHTFTPAGTNGTVGPDLDKLSQYAKQANQGSLDDFIHESIANPSSYIQPGYSNSMPNFGLSDKQIADLVAFLTKNQG
jgi:cytochrome c oxidase subunit 2